MRGQLGIVCSMYKEFYGLREYPFNMTPDPQFLFLSRNHRVALDVLLYGIGERKGFIAITGEVGAGKEREIAKIIFHKSIIGR